VIVALISERRASVDEIGAHIARHIMRVGRERGKEPHRIAYKHGVCPHQETEGGGLCESALASAVTEALRDFHSVQP
jgi:hypothetical protein